MIVKKAVVSILAGAIFIAAGITVYVGVTIERKSELLSTSPETVPYDDKENSLKSIVKPTVRTETEKGKVEEEKGIETGPIPFTVESTQDSKSFIVNEYERIIGTIEESYVVYDHNRTLYHVDKKTNRREILSENAKNPFLATESPYLFYTLNFDGLDTLFYKDLEKNYLLNKVFTSYEDDIENAFYHKGRVMFSYQSFPTKYGDLGTIIEMITLPHFKTDYPMSERTYVKENASHLYDEADNIFYNLIGQSIYRIDPTFGDYKLMDIEHSITHPKLFTYNSEKEWAVVSLNEKRGQSDLVTSNGIFEFVDVAKYSWINPSNILVLDFDMLYILNITSGEKKTVSEKVNDFFIYENKYFLQNEDLYFKEIIFSNGVSE